MSVVNEYSDLMELIGRYWDLAYSEGQEGRECDTPGGGAQQTLNEIERRVYALTHGGAK